MCIRDRVYADQRAELISQLRGIFTGAEGVDRVYGVDEFSTIGLPLPAASDQAPDLVLISKPDYAFSSKEGKSFITPPTEGGTHGYLNTDPKMQAIFLAWGADIPKGIHLNAISNLDVAPTIAALDVYKRQTSMRWPRTSMYHSDWAAVILLRPT